MTLAPFNFIHAAVGATGRFADYWQQQLSVVALILKGVSPMVQNGAFFVSLSQVPVYANNAAAIAGGLKPGNLYRTGADPDPVCVVR
jgi:hypothetical protein